MGAISEKDVMADQPTPIEVACRLAAALDAAATSPAMTPEQAVASAEADGFELKLRTVTPSVDELLSTAEARAAYDEALAKLQTQTYEGDLWHADESEDCVRFHRGMFQVFKAPKHDTPYAEYWPSPEMIRWMLDVLNAAEASGNTPGVNC